MIERHPRDACQLCGVPLYYAEQWQSLCRRCAEANGISRLCDRPRRNEFGAQPAPRGTVAEHLEREGLDHPNCRCVYDPLVDPNGGDLVIGEDGDLHAADCSIALEALLSAKIREVLAPYIGEQITPQMREAMREAMIGVIVDLEAREEPIPDIDLERILVDGDKVHAQLRADHGPFAGIDRGMAPERFSVSFLGGGGPPLTVELLREGMAKLLEHDARHPGPKPLIRRALAEYLLRAGCTRDQLDAFEIIE